MATKIKPQDIAKIIALKAAMSGARSGMPPQGMPPQGMPPQGPPPGAGAPPGMKKGGKVFQREEKGVEKKNRFAAGGSIKANGSRMGIESKGKTRTKIY